MQIKQEDIDRAAAARVGGMSVLPFLFDEQARKEGKEGGQTFIIDHGNSYAPFLKNPDDLSTGTPIFGKTQDGMSQPK